MLKGPWFCMGVIPYQPHACMIVRSAPCTLKIKNKQIGHHARPRRASATAPLRTGADICKTGSAAGRCAGAKSNTARRRSNHARTEDQAGREKRSNTDASGKWRVHTAVDTPRRNAATRSKHLSFMCHLTGLVISREQGMHYTLHYNVYMVLVSQCRC